MKPKTEYPANARPPLPAPLPGYDAHGCPLPDVDWDELTWPSRQSQQSEQSEVMAPDKEYGCVGRALGWAIDAACTPVARTLALGLTPIVLLAGRVSHAGNFYIYLHGGGILAAAVWLAIATYVGSRDW